MSRITIETLLQSDLWFDFNQLAKAEGQQPLDLLAHLISDYVHTHETVSNPFDETEDKLQRLRGSVPVNSALQDCWNATRPELERLSIDEINDIIADVRKEKSL